MSNNKKPRCLAQTKKRTRCQLPSSRMGYCYNHFLNHFNDIVQAILHACGAKGWNGRIEHYDSTSWKYVTVSVSRSIPNPLGPGWGRRSEQGVFEVTIDDGVRFEIVSGNSNSLTNLLNAMLVEIRDMPGFISSKQHEVEVNNNNDYSRLMKLLSKFDLAARSLSQRRRGKQSFELRDEYDVQDILYTFLLAEFEDVRREEAVPSHAGSNSRLDFLLPEQGIGIEVKMASESLRDPKIGEQMLADKSRYKQHPQCQMLIFFVYDPNHFIKNHSALKKEIGSESDGMRTVVVVSPR